MSAAAVISSSPPDGLGNGFGHSDNTSSTHQHQQHLSKDLGSDAADSICRRMDFFPDFFEEVLVVLRDPAYRFRVSSFLPSAAPNAQPAATEGQSDDDRSRRQDADKSENREAVALDGEGPTPVDASLRDRLRQFYEKHNPKKIETLEVFVSFWSGRETTLNMLLRERYGEDLKGQKLQNLLERFYAEVNPEKVSDSARIAKQYGKNERALCQALRHNYQKDYNGHTLERLLKEFYQENNPNKFKDIPKLVAAYSKHEESLNNQLRQTYSKDLADVRL